LTLPDGILEAAGLTEQECLIELAVPLYAQRRIKIGHALRMRRLSRREFEQ
jgi:predicted HTH domain antitoxin